MIQEIFTNVYRKNVWGSKETRSGKGSEIKATTILVRDLPKIFQKYNISGIIDIGCGECNWMRLLHRELKYYIGIDVVTEIVDKNKEKYGSKNIIFENDIFPYWLSSCYSSKYQAVLFSDVLVHLPNHMVIQYLDEIKSTGIEYILATTFPEMLRNTDVLLSEIAWRPMNLAIYPYNLGEPIEKIKYNEFYVCETGERIKSKYMGLWKFKKGETKK